MFGELSWLACRTARLKRDGTRAETRFSLSAKRTSPFKLAGRSVQSTTGSRGVRISGSNAGYTMFWGTVQNYWLPTPLARFPFTSPTYVTVCHHISTEFYITDVAVQRLRSNCRRFLQSTVMGRLPLNARPILKPGPHDFAFCLKVDTVTFALLRFALGPKHDAVACPPNVKRRYVASWGQVRTYCKWLHE